MWKTSNDWYLSCHCARCESQMNPALVNNSCLSSLKVECNPFSFLFRWCRCFRTHWDNLGFSGYLCGTKQWSFASRNWMSSWNRSFQELETRLRALLLFSDEVEFIDVSSLGWLFWVRSNWIKSSLLTSWATQSFFDPSSQLKWFRTSRRVWPIGK